MININNKKHLKILIFTLIAIVTLGIGYAGITAINLVINGDATASVNQENFKVHFTQAQAISGSTGASGTSSIDTQDDTKAMFDVTGLTKVGDYAEAVYTVRNDSNGIGAEITLNLTSSNSEYFKVTETILDNKLQAGEETTAKVKVEMIKTPITDSVSTSITATLTASPLENETATGGIPASKVAGDPDSFTTDSWATIKKAVQDNNTSAYSVGDTKTVSINNTDYTVRIANKSSAQNCSNSNYSQTACGFVIEFADIITTMQMRDTNTNVGGYPATLVFDYLNNTLLGQLPNDLQSVIEPTRVISGYGNNGTDSANFISTSQKLYLLSGVEVHGADSNDTAASTTSQLDYYVDMPSEAYDLCGGCGAIGTKYPRTIKQYNSTDTYWWLRPADSNDSSNFRDIDDKGILSRGNAGYARGVSPAFRIG